MTIFLILSYNFSHLAAPPDTISGSFWEIAMTASTDDFFRSRLDHMIDLRHPLAVLASRMPWQEIEASLAQEKIQQESVLEE